jgi:hypothetical protein
MQGVCQDTRSAGCSSLASQELQGQLQANRQGGKRREGAGKGNVRQMLSGSK